MLQYVNISSHSLNSLWAQLWPPATLTLTISPPDLSGFDTNYRILHPVAPSLSHHLSKNQLVIINGITIVLWWGPDHNYNHLGATLTSTPSLIVYNECRLLYVIPHKENILWAVYNHLIVCPPLLLQVRYLNMTLLLEELNHLSHCPFTCIYPRGLSLYSRAAALCPMLVTNQLHNLKQHWKD